MALKLLDPFIVRLSHSTGQDHWQGGPPLHENAVCCKCRRSLHLIWNIDTHDRRLVSKTGRRVFKTVDRLCLYWCMRCFESIDYILRSDGGLETILVGGKSPSECKRVRPDPSFPYPNFPNEFRKEQIGLFGLSEVPKVVRDLLSTDPPPKLTESRRKILETHVGHRVDTRGFELMRTWVHQFGGKPYLPQGDLQVVCRNSACRQMGKRMHIIAAVHNDPPSGLPFIETMDDVKKSPTGYFNYFVTLYFHVCKSCNSIHAQSQGS